MTGYVPNRGKKRSAHEPLPSTQETAPALHPLNAEPPTDKSPPGPVLDEDDCKPNQPPTPSGPKPLGHGARDDGSNEGGGGGRGGGDGRGAGGCPDGSGRDPGGAGGEDGKDAGEEDDESLTHSHLIPHSMFPKTLFGFQSSFHARNALVIDAKTNMEIGDWWPPLYWRAGLTDEQRLLLMGIVADAWRLSNPDYAIDFSMLRRIAAWCNLPNACHAAALGMYGLPMSDIYAMEAHLKLKGVDTSVPQMMRDRPVRF